MPFFFFPEQNFKNSCLASGTLLLWHARGVSSTRAFIAPESMQFLVVVKSASKIAKMCFNLSHATFFLGVN